MTTISDTIPGESEALLLQVQRLYRRADGAPLSTVLRKTFTNDTQIIHKHLTNIVYDRIKLPHLASENNGKRKGLSKQEWEKYWFWQKSPPSGKKLPEF